MSKSAKKQICAICENDVVPIYKPFCSKRCADVDLHRWLNGSYAIPCSDDESAPEGENEELPSQMLH